MYYPFTKLFALSFQEGIPTPKQPNMADGATKQEAINSIPKIGFTTLTVLFLATVILSFHIDIYDLHHQPLSNLNHFYD